MNAISIISICAINPYQKVIAKDISAFPSGKTSIKVIKILIAQNLESKEWKEMEFWNLIFPISQALNSSNKRTDRPIQCLSKKDELT
ncbi:MAG: hypothetical protein Q8M29_06685 [Bacteroidota bacterium]|nr:hypothetical protein [Bacteroidota bacterium]